MNEYFATEVLLLCVSVDWIWVFLVRKRPFLYLWISFYFPRQIWCDIDKLWSDKNSRSNGSLLYFKCGIKETRDVARWNSQSSVGKLSQHSGLGSEKKILFTKYFNFGTFSLISYLGTLSIPASRESVASCDVGYKLNYTESVVLLYFRRPSRNSYCLV